MSRKTRTNIDFSANPDQVEIGDWVCKTNGSLIGEVTGRVDTSPNMLQYWVMWFDGLSKAPVPQLASNLIKVPKSENGYVGKSIASGLISSMKLVGKKIKYEITTNLGTPRLLTKAQVEKELKQQQTELQIPEVGNKFVEAKEGHVNIHSIIIDERLQQRAEMSTEIIEEYAYAYREGIKLPSITVMLCEDENYYLLDGFHRVEAAKFAKLKELPCNYLQGTYREALLFSVSVNTTHGLRRSNADKHKAVMILLNDSEWSTWSNVAIAKQCGVSESFVRKIKKDSIFAQNEDTKLNNKRKVKRGGKIYTQDTTNIGKESPSKSFTPVDGEIIPKQLNEDIEVNVVNVFEENNLIDDVPVEIDNGNTDAQLTDSTNTKTSKGKQKITNPLSVGDRVKVKDGHYFGGKEGVVTQISSPTSVIVAFEDEQRDLFQLKDLDLPESLSKPQKPQKKEILIKEGCNYKAGEGCKWYVEVEEQIYKGLKIYQDKIGTLTLNSAFSRFLIEKGILKPYPNDSSKFFLS